MSKKSTVKKPSWKRDNSSKFFHGFGLNPKGAKKRISENNKLATLLKKQGWVYWDACNIMENGYTFIFHKNNLSFSWYWDNNGGDDFYVGELRGHVNLFPNDKFWHPDFGFEIRPILPRFIDKLPEFEARVTEAIHTQVRYFSTKQDIAFFTVRKP
jgi:hypothetical protein